MGKYQVILKPTAKKHLAIHKKSGNKAIMNKIQTLVAELEEHPYTGTGQPEQLKYELTGFGRVYNTHCSNTIPAFKGIAKANSVFASGFHNRLTLPVTNLLFI